jgi:hypothetical protein
MSCSEFSDIDLITFVAGDCDPECAERISEHLHGCTECRRTVEHHAAEKSEFLNRHSFEQYEQSIRNGESAATRRKTKLLQFPGRYALAASLVLFIVGGYVIRRTTMDRFSEATYRIKGRAGITVWSMGPDGAPQIRENGIYYPGDRIQLTYSSEDTTHLTVLGVEAGGAVQTYFPSNGTMSVPVEPGSDIPLPNSIVLDDYIGSEMYVAVFSKESISTKMVEEDIRRVYEHDGSFGAVAEALSEYGSVDTVRIHKKQTVSR